MKTQPDRHHTFFDEFRQFRFIHDLDTFRVEVTRENSRIFSAVDIGDLRCSKCNDFKVLVTSEKGIESCGNRVLRHP